MTKFVDGVAERSWPNPWGAATGRRYQVWCSDGKVRVATATAEPDTFFTIPGRVQIGGRTVTGSIEAINDIFAYPGVAEPPEGTRYSFTSHKFRKNGALLPVWPEPVLRP